jgi:spermidine/putrescine transport system permease protein
LRSFLQVTLPLSLPGVATGCMLVFILLMGEFLIPAMLGGGKVFFIGNALVDLFLQSRNWAVWRGGGGHAGGDHAWSPCRCICG